MEFDARTGAPFSQKHQWPRTWFDLQKRHSKASMWSPSSRGMRQNVHHFRAMAWHWKFAQMNTVYSARSIGSAKVTDGVFDGAEPGPYRIFAVYSVNWPS